MHEIIVRRAPNLDAGDRAEVRADAGVTLEAPMRLPDYVTAATMRASEGRARTS